MLRKLLKAKLNLGGTEKYLKEEISISCYTIKSKNIVSGGRFLGSPALS